MSCSELLFFFKMNNMLIYNHVYGNIHQLLLHLIKRDKLHNKSPIFLFFAKMMPYNDDVSRIWLRDTLTLVLNNSEYVDEHKW